MTTQQDFNEQNIIENQSQIEEDFQSSQNIIAQTDLPVKQRTSTSAQDLKVYHDFKDFPHTKWTPLDDKVRCPPSSYSDVRGLDNGEQMDRALKCGPNGKPIMFDLQNTWLKGEQYAHILQNQDRYCSVFGVKKYDQKQHPESIYIDPQDGLLYFVEGATIGSDFGFPRLGIRKRFKWKKMNFTTDLPKKDPLVSYIVASAVKCEKYFPGSGDDGPVYRMHAVILKKCDPRLQLSPLSPTSNQVSQQISQETNPEKLQAQPRSLHGRVLTKSNKLRNASAEKNDQEQMQPISHNYEKNYILCHVRRVMGKKEEEDDGLKGDDRPKTSQVAASRIPNKGKGQEQKIATSVQINKSKLDLKMIKSMTIEQQLAANLAEIGPDGKPKQLSLYKQKKILMAQQAAQATQDEQQSHGIKDKQIPQLKPNEGRKRQPQEKIEYHGSTKVQRLEHESDDSEESQKSCHIAQSAPAQPPNMPSTQFDGHGTQGNDQNYLQALNNLMTQQNLYGLNNLGLAGNLGLNQLGAMGNQNYLGANNLQGAALAAQAAQYQLLGLGGNLGLGGFNGLGQLGFQGSNMMGLNGINNIGALMNLQNLQTGILGQNPSFMALQNQFASQQETKQENTNGGKKREIKFLKKHESSKLGEINSNKVSPIISHLKNNNDFPGVSPQLLPIGNMGSLISGQNPGGVILGKDSKRKQTADGPMPLLGDKDLAGLADDLFNQCAKEYNRRLSGVHHLKDDEKPATSPAISIKSNKPITKVSDFMNSPKNRMSNIADQIGPSSREKSNSLGNIGRDRSNSAFQKFDPSNNDISQKEDTPDDKKTAKSPLIKGNQGEPSFGAASKQEDISINASQNRLSGSHESQERVKDKVEQQPKPTDPATNAPNAQALQIQQLQLLQQTHYQALLQNLQGSNSNLNNQQQSTEFQNNLQATLASGNQFLLMNPNFQNQKDGSSNNNTGPNALLYQQQLLQQQLSQQYQLNQIQQLQQLQGLGGGLFGQNQTQLQELLQMQQQQLEKDKKDQPQLNQQINIIQHSKFSPVLQGLFLNQNFNQGINQNQNQIKNNQANKKEEDDSPEPMNFKKRNKNSFLNEISNALAANPQQALNDDQREIKPSFTIQVPSGQEQRKESWFGHGSFGLGRKSTENVFQQRQSFSLGQEPGSSFNNFGVGAEKSSSNNIGHKFSITGNIFSSTSNNRPKKNSDINLKEPNSGSEIKSAERKESIVQKSSRNNSPFLGGLLTLNNSMNQGSSNFAGNKSQSQGRNSTEQKK